MRCQPSIPQPIRPRATPRTTREVWRLVPGRDGPPRRAAPVGRRRCARQAQPTAPTEVPSRRRGGPSPRSKPPALPAPAASCRPPAAAVRQTAPPAAAPSLPTGGAPHRSNLIVAGQPSTAVPAPACAVRARPAAAHGRHPQSKTPSRTGSHRHLTRPIAVSPHRDSTSTTCPVPPHPVSPPFARVLRRPRQTTANSTHTTPGRPLSKRLLPPAPPQPEVVVEQQREPAP